MSGSETSPVARALAARAAGRFEEVQAIVAGLVADCFGLVVTAIEIGRDRYSLNSVNGLLTVASGENFFFKFHHEEGEEKTLQEFYQAELLKASGYPVDVPVHVSNAIGRQILLYKRRDWPRFADLCRALDDPAAQPSAIAAAVRAQQDLDETVGRLYRATLHDGRAAEIAREPIHQLFHARLVDPGDPGRIGARARRFFWDRRFDLAGTVLNAEQLRGARWRINGVDYARTLDRLLAESLQRLAPGSLAGAGAVIAHGDAHNANLWYAGDRLVMFDPAFAGRHIPALLAEVKATVHNIFAHPLWLYDAPAAAETYHVSVRFTDERIEIESDWQLGALRRQFLASKAARVWRPLLGDLAARGWLPADWRRVLRLGFFCCPTLVMDLAAGGSGGHNPVSSTLGLAMAVMLGSEPAGDGADIVSRFLDDIDPAG